MEPVLIFDLLAPWLGGGAVTAAATFTVWLWFGWFRRDGEQREHHEQVLDDVREDRDYWRNMAIDRQKTLVDRDDEISQLKRKIAALERQNDLLIEQNKMFRDRLKKLGEL